MFSRWVLLVFAGCAVTWASSARAQDAPPWLHPACAPLPANLLGPFVTLGDGGVLSVESDNQVMVSHDEGQSWQSWAVFEGRQDLQVSNERALLRTKSGVLILAFMNMKEEAWKWNSATHDADPGTRLPTYVARSLDEGKTWQDIQMLHEEWTGAIRNMIQTRDGRIIFTSMKLLTKPGRHSVMTYSSADDGKTWKPSNILDLGGNGHHDGATEGTIEQLNDGRIYQLIRTNLGTFWEAFSEDGVYWRTMQPSSIDASSSPGLLKRLQSGRLALVWNRRCLEGQSTYPPRGGDCEWSETPASVQREELVLALSEDDGKTWSAPVVVARKPGGILAYPYLYERAPGALWLTTMQGPVRVSFREQDFVPVPAK